MSPYEKSDLVVRLILGLVGVAITVFLGMIQKQLTEMQTNLATQQVEIQKQLALTQEQQTEIQILTTVRGYLSSISKIGEEGDRARKIISIAAKRLSEEYKNPMLALLAQELLPKPDTSAPEIDKPSFQIAEATAVPLSTTDWFAIVATFRPTSRDIAKRARKHFAQMFASQGEKYEVDIYQTQSNKNYAITIGGRLPKVEATRLALLAREKGWADDAYLQIDRNWTKIE